MYHPIVQRFHHIHHSLPIVVKRLHGFAVTGQGTFRCWQQHQHGRYLYNFLNSQTNGIRSLASSSRKKKKKKNKSKASKRQHRRRTRFRDEDEWFRELRKLEQQKKKRRRKLGSPLKGDESPEEVLLYAQEDAVLPKVSKNRQQGYHWLSDHTPFDEEDKHQEIVGGELDFGYDEFSFDHFWNYTHHFLFDEPINIGHARTCLMLTKEDLSHLPSIKVDNPRNPNYPPVTTFEFNDVVNVAYHKHGGPTGFLEKLRHSAGFRNRRVGNNAKSTTITTTKLLSENSDDQEDNWKKWWHQLEDVVNRQLGIPLYQSNEIELLVTMSRGDITSSHWKEALKEAKRLYFLMTFTQYPILRDAYAALIIWVSRFGFNKNDNQRFEVALQNAPSTMQDEIQTAMGVFFDGKSSPRYLLQKGSKVHSSSTSGKIKVFSTSELEELDTESRLRMAQFVALGLPNLHECALVNALVSAPVQNRPEPLRSFPYLFRCEWVPISGVGQGELVFVNERSDAFAVVEAKSVKTSRASKLALVRRQSAWYKECLELEIADPQEQIVLAGTYTEDGFEWLDDEQEERWKTHEAGRNALPDKVQITKDPLSSLGVDSDEEEAINQPELDSSTHHPDQMAQLVQFAREARQDELCRVRTKKKLLELAKIYHLDTPVKSSREDIAKHILEEEASKELFEGEAAARWTHLYEELSEQSPLRYGPMTPSRQEQLESMRVKQELVMLRQFYNLPVSIKSKPELVQAILAHEEENRISGGF